MHLQVDSSTFAKSETVMVLSCVRTFEDSKTAAWSRGPPCERRILHQMCFTLENLWQCSLLHNVSILLVKIVLCGKLHCQISFKLKHISYRIFIERMTSDRTLEASRENSE